MKMEEIAPLSENLIKTLHVLLPKLASGEIPMEALWRFARKGYPWGYIADRSILKPLAELKVQDTAKHKVKGCFQGKHIGNTAFFTDLLPEEMPAHPGGKVTAYSVNSFALELQVIEAHLGLSGLLADVAPIFIERKKFLSIHQIEQVLKQLLRPDIRKRVFPGTNSFNCQFFVSDGKKLYCADAHLYETHLKVPGGKKWDVYLRPPESIAETSAQDVFLIRN